MKFHLCVVVFMISIECTTGQGRPRIGLTLSGGGAKGLAHIGILKAIDSAGLRIDAVTGTSMGSIMGALYAVGYSGKEIEKIAKAIDWSSMFSNRPPYNLINVHEKREFANYAIELQLEKGKPKFFSGLIEAEEIWLKFGELFYPVHDIKDFSQFSIPFSCIATDAATGKAVVLKDGDIVRAVRASMSIPSIFSAVNYQDTKLIDGGVVRNFPVRDARELGADYLIGVNLSAGLLPADKLVSSIDMLYQIGFYKDADDFQHEKKMCNLLIEPPLSDYSAGSFGAADSIMDVGNETGKKYYPIFKRLADSLQAIYPDAVPNVNRLPPSGKTIIDEIEIAGLKEVDYADFQGKLGLPFGKPVTGNEISGAVRKAFSSGNFRRLAFFLDPLEAGHTKLRCEVVENARTQLKLGVHYHSYTDIALIGTLATRNIIRRSKSFLKLNISDNFRVLFRHDQAFGKMEKWGGLFSAYFENMKFPVYEDLKLSADYSSTYSALDFKIYKLLGTENMIGVGTAREWLALTPNITQGFDYTGTNSYWNTYFFFQRNSLDQKIFPRRGAYIDLQGGIIYNQNPDFYFTVAGDSIFSDSLNLPFNAYQQLKFKAGKYFPITPRWTFMLQTSNGINFNYNPLTLNFYSAGGINDFIRNQIPFVGLTENQGNTGSASAFLGGLQYEPWTNFLATFRANLGVYDYVEKEFGELSTDNVILGYGFSAGYRSPIGPIEISLISNNKTQDFKGYVNLGFTF